MFSLFALHHLCDSPGMDVQLSAAALCFDPDGKDMQSFPLLSCAMVLLLHGTTCSSCCTLGSRLSQVSTSVFNFKPLVFAAMTALHTVTELLSSTRSVLPMMR